MKNLLLTIGVVAVGYALYRQWLMNSEKPKMGVLVKEETNKAIRTAVNSTNINVMANSEVFGSMKDRFNADIAATVAPSINAKIGIF
jgi:hypothetical protein